MPRSTKLARRGSPGGITFLHLSTGSLRSAGQMGRQRKAIEDAIAHCKTVEEYWAIAELLRVKGELLLSGRAPEAARMAEDHFQQALDWAGPAGCALLATARRHEPRPAVARSGPVSEWRCHAQARLRSVHRGVRYGYLIEAKRLLVELKNVGDE